MNRRELAEVVDVSRQAVESWLSGKAIPHKRSLTRLATALGTTVEWLIEGTGGQFGIPPGDYDVYRSQIDRLSPEAREIYRLLTIAMTSGAASVRNLYEKVESGYRAMVQEGEKQLAEIRRLKVARGEQLTSGQIGAILNFAKLLDSKKILPDSGKPVKTPPMKIPTLSELLDQVREATKAAGSKKALAESIGISQQQLSDWLSRSPKSYKPSGESALRLFEWVQTRAAQPKQSVEDALTPPTRKIRSSSKPSYEKAISDPKRRSNKKRNK